MLSSALSNVSLGTASILAYAMLAMVAVLLVSGPVVVYYYYRKVKRTKAAEPAALLDNESCSNSSIK